jgi:hypothetical protein
MGLILFRDPRPAIWERMRSQGWLMITRGDELDAILHTIGGCFREFEARLTRMPVPACEALLDQIMRFEQNAILLVGVEVKNWSKAWGKGWHDEYAPIVTREHAIECTTQIINDLGNNLKNKAKDHDLVNFDNKSESLVILYIETLIEDLLIRLGLLINGWS